MSTRMFTAADLRWARILTPENKRTAKAASSVHNAPSPVLSRGFFKFLELPAEIRTMIYHVVFGDTLDLACQIRRGNWKLYCCNASGGLIAVGYERLSVQILQVNHAIRDEAAPIFWGHHSFFAASSLNAEDLALTIGLQNARLVRKLKLGMWGRKSYLEVGWAGERTLDKQSYFSRHVARVFTGLQDLTINGLFTRKRTDIKEKRVPADRRLAFFKQELPHLTNPVIKLKDESARLTSPEIKTDKAAKMYDHKESMQLRKASALAKTRATIARKKLAQAINAITQ